MHRCLNSRSLSGTNRTVNGGFTIYITGTPFPGNNLCHCCLTSPLFVALHLAGKPAAALPLITLKPYPSSSAQWPPRTGSLQPPPVLTHLSGLLKHCITDIDTLLKDPPFDGLHPARKPAAALLSGRRKSQPSSSAQWPPHIGALQPPAMHKHSPSALHRRASS